MPKVTVFVGARPYLLTEQEARRLGQLLRATFTDEKTDGMQDRSAPATIPQHPRQYKRRERRQPCPCHPLDAKARNAGGASR